MRLKTKLAAIFVLISLCPVLAFAAPHQGGGERVLMEVFWGISCGHCRAQKPFLKELEARYPRLVIRQYEVYESVINRDIFTRTAQSHGVQPNGVPAVFVAGKSFFGNSQENQQAIEATVVEAIANLPPVQKSELGEDETAAQSSPGNAAGNYTADSAERAASADRAKGSAATTGAGDHPNSSSAAETSVSTRKIDTVLRIPLVGEVDIKNYSLMISTLLIAFVDGFNPCSLWVLTLLLGLVLNSHSRRRTLMVGGLFLFTTATIYGVFVAGVFKMLTLLSFIFWIQWVVALFALVFGLVNIKDYFWFKKGFSFTIADSSKPGIYRSIRGLLNPNASGLALAVATVVMAAGIALVELPCTAGFPVIWSELVRAQQVAWPEFFLLMVIYLLVYLLDEIIIFMIAVVTMQIGRFEEKQGRNLKLIGGLIMVALAAVLLIQPDLMNSIGGMILVFGGCGLLAALIIGVRRWCST